MADNTHDGPGGFYAHVGGECSVAQPFFSTREGRWAAEVRLALGFEGRGGGEHVRRGVGVPKFGDGGGK